jgi:formylglycine-generating enzyme required for sulfatase activity
MFEFLRQGLWVPVGQKVMVVLDQFEQWLHARRAEPETQLHQALRHCDAEHLQCLCLVRDDFWVAASRFMQVLEIELIEGQNLALVDLFDPLHARKVLAEFGQAYSKLPENLGALSRDQKAFLDRAVEGLLQEGRIICVRLALFADMVKGKPWSMATLNEVGGLSGLGVTFLEETFSSENAPAQHRFHQKAAQAILRALLPETGTNIKGGMRSEKELLGSSGYARRPKDFDNLVRILDTEIRLITPTDPEGLEAYDATSDEPHRSEKHYQLTHDYLVPSLREWLTSKQKETRRGRAELRLAERAAVWNAKPENRQLPSVWEWLNIRLLTRKNTWSDSHRKMMRKASRVHGLRWATGLFLAAAAVILAIELWGHTRAAGLVDALVNAEITEVPKYIQELTPYRRWADPLLLKRVEETKEESKARLHASLALLPVDSGQLDYLCGQLLVAKPDGVAVIARALASHKDAITDRLWDVVERPPRGQESQRLRAACALAVYSPNDSRWQKVADQAAGEFVSVSPVFFRLWLDAVKPVKAKLVPRLCTIFRDASRPESERLAALSAVVAFAGDRPDLLVDLIADADERRFFNVLFSRLESHGDRATSLLQTELAKAVAARRDLPLDSAEGRAELAKRQANLAVALLRMGNAEPVWPLLKQSEDPSVRSYIIHRVAPLGADPTSLIQRLAEEKDPWIRRALVLSLGEFTDEQLPPEQRKPWIEKLADMYQNDPGPGIHGAAEWLLRKWGEDERLEQIDKQLPPEELKGDRRWYVTTHGHTMVIVDGPVEFMIGSPTAEADRDADEVLHKVRIPRSYAIASKEVTVEQFQQLMKDHGFYEKYAAGPECPAINVNWHAAAEYCNRLSKAEGLDQDQWCYISVESGESHKSTRLAPDYLGRTGYRLPTEAEWEYACRAHSSSSRYFGESEALLPQYGWYVENAKDRTSPVGKLKPNDFGLFDMYGNVLEWCQEKYSAYSPGLGGAPVEDREDIESLEAAGSGIAGLLRGGAFNMPASYLRSAHRTTRTPHDRGYSVGFRVARTCP